MDLIEIKMICPVYRTEKILPFPKSPILEKKGDLTTVFIHKG
ncbi:MAG: hypothetical protein ACFFA4_01305 [Promethearchaeota archaeon]